MRFRRHPVKGPFLSGVLVNPRGGVLPGPVFVIASEWDCG
jgi:hypothetical protein